MGRNIYLSESLSSKAKLNASADLKPQHPHQRLGILLAAETQRHILLPSGCESQKVGLQKRMIMIIILNYKTLCKRFNLCRVANLASDLAF